MLSHVKATIPPGIYNIVFFAFFLTPTPFAHEIAACTTGRCRYRYKYPSLTRVYWHRELSGDEKIMVDVGYAVTCYFTNRWPGCFFVFFSFFQTGRIELAHGFKVVGGGGRISNE